MKPLPARPSTTRPTETTPTTSSSSVTADRHYCNANETVQAIDRWHELHQQRSGNRGLHHRTGAADAELQPGSRNLHHCADGKINEAAAGATIYYTTNGSTPTTSSTNYSGPITVNANETLQAIAAGTNYTNSAVASAAYTIAPVLPTPSFSVAAGTYTTAQTVAISDTTTGATIYYTTNGTTPTTSSTKYSGTAIS